MNVNTMTEPLIPVRAERKSSPAEGRISLDGSRIVTRDEHGDIDMPPVPGSVRDVLIAQMTKLGYGHRLEKATIALEQGAGHPGDAYEPGARREVMLLGIVRVIEDQDMREIEYADVFERGMIELPISPTKRAELRALALREGCTVRTVYRPSGEAPDDETRLGVFSRPTSEVILQDGVPMRGWDLYDNRTVRPLPDPSSTAPDEDHALWDGGDDDPGPYAGAPARRTPAATREPAGRPARHHGGALFSKGTSARDFRRR